MLQRIALAASTLAILIASGCEGPQRAERRPLPDPVVSTGRKPYLPEPAPPPAPRVVPAPTPPALADLDPRNIFPARFDGSRWHVIVVHHSASPKDTPASMDRFHRIGRGWNRGLGYHFVIGNGVNFPDGQVFVGPRWRNQETGAHTKAAAGNYFGTRRPANFFNDHGIGICLIGDFTSSQPTPRQMQTLAALIDLLCSRTAANPSRIYGHGQVTNGTACPGRFLTSRLAEVKRQVTRSAAVDEHPLGSWIDVYAAAAPYGQFDGPATFGRHFAEGLQGGYRTAVDAFYDVAYGQAAAFGRSVACDVEDDQAAGVALAHVGCDLCESHAAPQHGSAAHPAYARQVAALDLDPDALRPAAALHLDLDALADFARPDQLGELARITNRFAIETGQQVAGAQPAAAAGPLGLDPLDHDAGR